MRVVIYHNVARDPEGRPLGMFEGYRPEHPITPVAAYEAEDWMPHHAAILEDAWRLFNVGDDPEFGTPDERAVAYRQRGNRSLSVGDVVGVDGVFYAVADTDWHQIQERPHIESVAVYGTSAIDLS